MYSIDFLIGHVFLTKFETTFYFGEPILYFELGVLPNLFFEFGELSFYLESFLMMFFTY